MKQFSIFFATIAVGILGACRPPGAQFPTVSPTASLTPTMAATPTPSSLPIQYLEFSDLNSAQKAARFPLWLPSDIPDDLSFYKAWVSDYADGSQNVRVVYQELGDSMDATLQSLDIQMTETNQLLTLDSIMQQARANPQDVREVQVRGQPGGFMPPERDPVGTKPTGQTGYSYWTPSVAAGNFAILTWREGTITIQLSLSGDWPQPDSSQPHALDDLLLEIAESLQTGS